MAPLVTIPNRPRRLRYSASAGQVAFPYNFPIIDAADLEVRRFRAGVETLLAVGGDYTVTGAGEQDGGTVSLVVPAQAGDLLVLRGNQAHARSTVFTNGGDLRAEAMLAEFNRQVISVQQLAQQITQTVRLPASDPTDLAEMPNPTGRANAVLGFGAAGEVVMVPRISVGAGAAGFQQAGTGAVQRTQQDELARVIHPRQFGAAGDGTADDTQAVQAAANYAASRGYTLALDDGDFLVTNSVTVPSAVAGIQQTGRLIYAGPAGKAALLIGDGGGVKCQGKRMTGLRVVRQALATWLDEADVGIVLRNVDACQIEVAEVWGFTIGVQALAESNGCEDSTITLGRIIDCRFGLDLRCTTPAAWCNSMRWIGGHFANSSATHPTLSRYGVRLSAQADAYDRHNAHAFYGAGFELQRQGTPATVEAIPFLIEVGDARGIHGHDLRMEACSRQVCKVTGQASDCSFSVSYTGTYGWTGNEVLYGPDVTRNGVTVSPRHLAQGAISATRLFADAGNLRARAYRDNSVSASGQGLTGGVGFEGLAILSGNPQGPPTTLDGFCFPGLTLVENGAALLTNDAVGLNSSRAVAFVVDTRQCREIVVAAEGEQMRLIVQQFDAAENVLGQAARPTLSGANLLWNPGRDAEQHVVEGIGTAFWWEMNVNLDEPLLINRAGEVVDTAQGINRLQRVRVHESCAYAVIGIRGGEAGAKLRSLRLYCTPTASPPILYGGGRRWGQRDRTTMLDIDPPSIAAGARHSVSVTVPGARHGDMVQAGFTQTTGYSSLSGNIVVDAAVSAPDTVTVWMTNLHTAAIDLAAGTLYVQTTKPRL